MIIVFFQYINVRLLVYENIEPIHVSDNILKKNYILKYTFFLNLMKTAD